MMRAKRGWEIIGLAAEIIETLRLDCDVKVERMAVLITEISRAQKLEIFREIMKRGPFKNNISAEMSDDKNEMVFVKIYQMTSEPIPEL